MHFCLCPILRYFTFKTSFSSFVNTNDWLLKSVGPKVPVLYTFQSILIIIKIIFPILVFSVSSTETDINTRLAKAWTAIDSQSVIWKSDLTDKMKRSFFQTAVVSILLYGCTTWTLTKRMEKKLDGNKTRILRAILNKSWGQHPTKQQLFGHLPPITKTMKIRRTRHVGHCWRSKDELICDVLLWTPSHGRAEAGRPARTYTHSSVPIRDVALKTCQKRWTIEKGGEKGSGISVLMVRHDDDGFPFYNSFCHGFVQ